MGYQKTAFLNKYKEQYPTGGGICETADGETILKLVQNQQAGSEWFWLCGDEDMAIHPALASEAFKLGLLTYDFQMDGQAYRGFVSLRDFAGIKRALNSTLGFTRGTKKFLAADPVTARDVALLAAHYEGMGQCFNKKG